MRRFLLLAACTASLTASAVPAGGPTLPGGPGLGTIRAADLMKTVEYLASPRFGGRPSGGPGYLKAARAMAARFHSLGMRPGGEDGFFQRLEIEYEEIDACRLALLLPDGSMRRLRLGPDFVARGLSGSGRLSVPVVFAGYGLSAPEQGYDDYAGIDARGKIVLAFKTAPPFRPDSLGWGDRLEPRPRGRAAAAHGARGLLLVAFDDPEGLTMPIGSFLEGPGPQDEDFPRLMVDVPIAEEMVSTAGLRLAELKAAIDSTRRPQSHDLAVQARLDVRARYRARQPSVNVVALLEGSDPVLREECLVIGAHLDHVGAQAGELWFPGANDNASGAAAVLALARAFAQGERPMRSVAFVLFSSEEAGLDGSRRFVADPPVPPARIVAFLNLDCVAVGDSIQLGNGKSSPRLWQLARDLDARGSRLSVAATWGEGSADATPFFERGIPALYFASQPSYAHIHQAGDTPATLNPRLFEELVRLAYRVAWQVAQGGYPRE